MPRIYVPILFLAACGYKQEDFAVEYAEAACQVYADCGVIDKMDDFEGIEDCTALLKTEKSESGGSCADYDRKAAADCVSALNTMSCDSLYAGDAWPAACDAACLGGT